MVRRREREDYAPEEKEPWEKREEQYERERKKRDRTKKKKKESWEKREEQRERERRKKEKKLKEKKPKERYEEFEDYEERAKVEPIEEFKEPKKALVSKEPFKPTVYAPYTPFFEGDIQDEEFRRYAIQQVRGYVPAQPTEYRPGIIDWWLIEEERAFEGISKKLWGEAEKVRPVSKPLSFEEQAYRMGKRKIPDIETAFARAKYGGIHLGAGFIEGVTFPARPLAWWKTGKGLVELGISPEKRRQFGEAYRERPGAFGLQALGGLAGGYTAGKLIGLGKTKIAQYRQKKFMEKYPVEKFLPYEERMAFPEEVVSQRPSSSLFVRKKVRVYDITKREPRQFKIELGYYGKQKPGAVRGTPLPDLEPSSPVLWEFKSGRWTIPIDQKVPKATTKGPWISISKPKKGLLYRLGEEYGLVKTGHELIPEILPKGVGEPKTILIPWTETVKSHIPGLRIGDIGPTITKPFRGPTGILGLLGGA